MGRFHGNLRQNWESAGWVKSIFYHNVLISYRIDHRQSLVGGPVLKKKGGHTQNIVLVLLQ